jgi:hypothetical protein
MTAKVWTLKDWPEDVDFSCSNPTCARRINNGEQYVIVPDTIKILCATCSHVDEAIVQARQQMQEREEALMSASKRRQAEQARRPRRTKQPARASERGKRGSGGAGAPSTTSRETTAVSCPVCEVTFYPRIYATARGKQVYCSYACSARSRRVYADVVCSVCGILFRPNAQRAGRKRVQRYCSHGCAMKGRRVERPLRQGTCRNCGRAFTSSHNRPSRPQQFCSKSCRWYGQRNRTNPNPPVLRWTQKYAACVCCRSTARRHRGGGYCSRCYRRHETSCAPVLSAVSAEDMAS